MDFETKWWVPTCIAYRRSWWRTGISAVTPWGDCGIL